jgi:hypothetical protein
MYYVNHTYLQVHSTYDGNSADSVHSDFPREEVARSSINYYRRQVFLFVALFYYVLKYMVYFLKKVP